MDPTTALAIVADTSELHDDRQRAAEALRHWLDAGGFPPSGYSAAQTRDALRDFERETVTQ